MTIYPDLKENAFIAYDRILDFVGKVGWMSCKERDQLREYINTRALGWKPSVRDRVLELIDEIEAENI